MACNTREIETQKTSEQFKKPAINLNRRTKMEAMNENNLSISEFQDQDLQLTADNQIVELSDNEIDNISGGVLGASIGGVIAWGQGKRGWDVAETAFIGALGAGSLGASLFGPWGALGGVALSTPKE
jgi:hypothetical protein